MSISVSQLENLLSKLQRLRDRIAEAGSPTPHRPIAENDPLLDLARECDFLLPAPLTRETLSSTVSRKINNVLLLLERARQNEELPEAARIAADNEDLLVHERAPGGSR